MTAEQSDIVYQMENLDRARYQPTWEGVDALVARVRKAEAVIAEALDVARSASVPLGVPEARHYDRLLAETRRVLSTYEKGAPQ